MSLITLFQDKIKPLKLRGTGMLNPVPTSKIDNNLYAIKDGDVNLWIYKKNNTTLAIDTGYKNNIKLKNILKKFNIKNEKIDYVFLTHADIDHAGGLISDDRFASNAQIYLHTLEENMLLGKEKRFKFSFIKINNPVNYKGKYNLFKDKEEFNLNDIKIKCYHTPGHTKGHSSFLIDDKYLFTGDSLAINEEGGYCFFDFYNMNTKQNIKSIKKLKNYFKNNNDIIVCTSHSGMHNIKESFLHIDKIAKGTKKKPFDKKAPYDVFK